MDKQAIRERIWDRLEAEGVARFPFPPHGRIPNVAGAKTAAQRLAETDAWRNADTLKCNPDSPQLPVRRRALAAGKTLYVAVPRLREEACFLRLADVDDIGSATTIDGISEYGTPVRPADVEPVDLVVAGSVAVTANGARVGKGEGYSDLEFALLRAFDRVDNATTTATTVHELQVVDDAPTTPRDVPIDLVCTPERTLQTDPPGGKPAGIDWDALNDERLEEIPILRQLAPDSR